MHAWVHIDDLPLESQDKKILREKLAKHINHDDELWAECQEERSQEENREHVVEHLNNLIEKALEHSEPRIPTEPPRSSNEERLHDKHHHAQVKHERFDAHHPEAGG